MKVSQNFELQEFIDPVTWAEKKDKSINLIDSKLINIAQYIRSTTGKPVTINNWHRGGPYKESGLRRKDTSTGAKFSQHKMGKAIDVKIHGMTGAQMNDWAKAHKTELFNLGVRQIEHKSLTKTWLHLSTKNTGVNGIQIIDLVKVVETWPV